MSVQIPIVNAPNLYIQGMYMGWTDGTHITVSSGRARNSSDINDILSDVTVTINAAVQGAGGIDIGALANNTLYAVYAVGDSSAYKVTTALISANLTQPLLPSGYDMYRRIGYVLTDGAAAILKFYQTGSSTDRTMWYDVAIQELNAGASAVYAAVNIATSVPPSAIEVIFNAVLTPTGNGDTAHVRPTGAAGANGYAIIGGSQAGVALNNTMRVPCNATPSVDYKVTGTLTLNTRGYIDQL